MLGLHTRRSKLFLVVAILLLDIVIVFFRGLGILAALLSAGLIVYAVIVLLRVTVRRSRLIWHLRDRLIVTYMFMGAVPIVLILALAYCGAWIVVGQVAAYLVGAEIDRHAVVLENPARFLSQSTPAERADILKEMAPLLRSRVPGFQVIVTGDQDYRYPADSSLQPPPNGWKNYTGTVLKDGKFYSMSLARTGPRTAVILAPLSPEVLERLVPGIGSVGFARVLGARTSFLQPPAGIVPDAYNSFDFGYTWLNQIGLADWNEPDSRRSGVYLAVSTRPSAVLGVVFGDRVDIAQFSLQVFIAIAVLLAMVEIASIVIGVSMTRTITNAVHNIYEGTQRIGRGDFSHKIPVRGRDQLASLGQSFNEMSGQLEKLVKVAKEKERLQSELTIASEVQNQLFPRSAPPSKTIRLTGACEPARSVSGDYYDYLCLPNGNLALAIGDVAGKGISAALLMASIQSIMRTQLAQGPPVPSTMVAQLNRQLYANTSPEKYATFFFGIYDENNRMLTYTNAGHLSPILFCGGNVSSLEVTGTVVGLFPSIVYEEQSVRFCDGDLLVAYTDGITEPENAYGEEFGAARLTETVERYQNMEPCEIVARVMESVKHWSGAPELPDDMTVLIAKGVA
ncbi:MAG TPA: SpoIIE family protein phosphatase [Bryobacteraceae bacterium]|nr:SpoIIE family protein phosphatase [Bryobacteraceae bacterium]